MTMHGSANVKIKSKVNSNIQTHIFIILVFNSYTCLSTFGLHNDVFDSSVYIAVSDRMISK